MNSNRVAESQEKQLAFQKWMADGHPGVFAPPSTSETEFRRIFGMVTLLQELRQGQITLQEYGDRVRELCPGRLDLEAIIKSRLEVKP